MRETESLVHLEVDIDVSDKLEGGKEGDGAEHEEEDVAGEGGVAKELHALQHARHVGALEVVEHGVQEHKRSRRPATTEAKLELGEHGVQECKCSQLEVVERSRRPATTKAKLELGEHGAQECKCSQLKVVECF